MEKIKLSANGLKEIHQIDEKLLSYNIEMTEVTGGTFWKALYAGTDCGNRRISSNQ